MKWLLIPLHLLFAVFAGAQSAKPAPAQAPTAAMQQQLPASYEFDDASKLRIRELQYQNDQLEIEIQKMEVQIAQKRALQEQEVNAMKQVAYDFAVKHGVALDKYILDPAGVRFVKK